MLYLLNSYRVNTLLKTGKLPNILAYPLGQGRDALYVTIVIFQQCPKQKTVVHEGVNDPHTSEPEKVQVMLQHRLCCAMAQVQLGLLCCTYPPATENTWPADCNEGTCRSSLLALAITPPACCTYLKAKQHVLM